WTFEGPGPSRRRAGVDMAAQGSRARARIVDSPGLAVEVGRVFPRGNPGAAQPGSPRLRRSGRLIRWLTLAAGVGGAAAALDALLSAPPPAPARRSPAPAVAAPAPRAPGAPRAQGEPLGEIDDASRAQLERVL